MNLNPKNLLKAKSAWSSFRSNHPNVLPFLKDVLQKGIKEDVQVEILVHYPDGTDTEHPAVTAPQNIGGKSRDESGLPSCFLFCFGRSCTPVPALLRFQFRSSRTSRRARRIGVPSPAVSSIRR